jgi:hypothetical protein
MCFVVRKTILKLERVILTTLFLPVQKTPTMIIFHHVLFDESSPPLILQPLVDKLQPSLPTWDPCESTLDLVPIRVCARD